MTDYLLVIIIALLALIVRYLWLVAVELGKLTALSRSIAARQMGRR